MGRNLSATFKPVAARWSTTLRALLPFRFGRKWAVFSHFREVLSISLYVTRVCMLERVVAEWLRPRSDPPAAMLELSHISSILNGDPYES